MLGALAAASSAIDLLKSLTSSKKSSTPTADFSATTAASSDGGSTISVSVAGAAPTGHVSPQTMSALLDAQSQSSATPTSTSNKSQSKALKDLFGLIDGNGDGSVTKSEFSDALGAGGTNTANANSVFDKLDSDGNGSVSMAELSSALKGKGGRHHGAHGAGSATASGTGPTSSDPLLQALDGASTASTTNSDGSKTSLTYADGSKVTTTSAPSASASSSATSSYNFLEQMIQRQANTIASGSTLSVSA